MLTLIGPCRLPRLRLDFKLRPKLCDGVIHAAASLGSLDLTFKQLDHRLCFESRLRLGGEAVGEGLRFSSERVHVPLTWRQTSACISHWIVVAVFAPSGKSFMKWQILPARVCPLGGHARSFSIAPRATARARCSGLWHGTGRSIPPRGNACLLHSHSPLAQPRLFTFRQEHASTIVPMALIALSRRLLGVRGSLTKHLLEQRGAAGGMPLAF